jgi:uncharacterized cofD-like protein
MMLFSRDSTVRKWLTVGLNVKRWLVLLFLGVTVLSLGFAYFLVNLYRTQAVPPVFYYLTLQFIPRLYRALLFGLVGTGMIVIAVYKLNQSLLAAFRSPAQSKLVDVIYRHRRRERGPKVVVIGGGTGLSTLLRGLKEHTSNITAIVTVADDGGSSGRLRRELGLLPPGDLRNCIAALADSEALTTQLFQYRFGQGVGLNGHSFGNLFIAAMAGVTGSFEEAIAESSKVLAVQGRILPSTLHNVILCADVVGADPDVVEGPIRVSGESEIPKAGRRIERVFLEPEDVPAYPEAVRAILEADLIVAGPGSLYTSVLPNLLVPDIARAIRASSVSKVYVCNVATQLGETEGYGVDDHIEALERHLGHGLFSHVLVNSNTSPRLPSDWRVELILPRYRPSKAHSVILADVIDRERPWRHDSWKLADSLMAHFESQVRLV